MLAPMLIMTHYTSQSARLITVCVAVLLFGFLFAVGTRATNQEVLAASAAYAAVHTEIEEIVRSHRESSGAASLTAAGAEA